MVREKDKDALVDRHNLHVRVAILSPGAEVTALKFRGWLRAEAADIDRKTREGGEGRCASIIQLHVLERVRAAMGPARLDKLLRDMVNKFDTIIRIELHTVSAPLTLPQLLQARDEAARELDVAFQAVSEGENAPR